MFAFTRHPSLLKDAGKNYSDHFISTLNIFKQITNDAFNAYSDTFDSQKEHTTKVWANQLEMGD